MNRKICAALFLLPALSGAAAMTGQAEQEVVPGPPTSSLLARTSVTVTGQALHLPEPVEVVISVTELPAGGLLPQHKHPWPRYAYVERGRLRVSYENGRLVREVGAGEVLVEAVNQWHEGRVVGAEPARILVVDHVPPGETNMVRR